MTHTERLISNLTDVNTSQYDRDNSLHILTKHNYFTSIHTELKDCYYTEDYARARNLIQIELDRAIIVPTKIDTSYTKRFHNGIHYKRANTKQTFGISIATQGGNTNWIEAMDRQEAINNRLEIANNPMFNNMLSKYRKILKRKARLSANKRRVSKNNKVTKYKKRASVVLPSQRGL